MSLPPGPHQQVSFHREVTQTCSARELVTNLRLHIATRSVLNESLLPCTITNTSACMDAA